MYQRTDELSLDALPHIRDDPLEGLVQELSMTHRKASIISINSYNLYLYSEKEDHLKR